MAVLSLSDAHLAFGHVALLDGASFSLEAGERLGLIGRNGAGKSSLLKIVAGLEKPDDGLLQVTQGLRIRYVPQEPLFDAARSVFEVREPIYQETRDGTILTIVPDKKFRVSCTNVGPNGRFTQYFSTEINPETYEKEIAAARTFVYYEDIAPLMEKGLIKGGTLEAAIVIRGDSLLSKQPLRFTNEFVRHKILDIVGDLTLSGRRITGHVIAVRPGHGPNTELARAIVKQYETMRSMVPMAINIPSGDAVLDINEVMKILPHRYPFLLVDRIIGFEGETKCTGIKNVTINEPFFPGHFPADPIMPGVLLVEAMAQTAAVLAVAGLGPAHAGNPVYFMSIDSARFRRPVRPGDQVRLEITVLRNKMGVWKFAGRAVVESALSAEAEFSAKIMSR